MMKRVVLFASVLGIGACAPESEESAALGAGSQNLRSAGELTCGDGQASEVVLEAKAMNVWPPNHQLHTITVADCVDVQSACGLTGEFVWASSDEPVDDIGDGHHAPDIIFGDCETVQIRAERQGPRDGRVYKLGVRVVDAFGHATESACTVVVDHDRRRTAGADSGESYRIVLDGNDGRPACDGSSVAPSPEAPDPGVDPTTPAPAPEEAPPPSSETPDAPTAVI